MATLFNSRTAARVGIEQARTLAHADQIADGIDAQVARIWGRILRLMSAKPMPLDARTKIAGWLRDIYALTLNGLSKGMKTLAQVSHARTVQTLLQDTPQAALAVALTQDAPPPGKSAPLREEKLTPSQRAQVEAQLFPSLTADQVIQIVHQNTGGRSWQSRIAQISALAPPEQLASLVVQGMSQGQTVDRMARMILPSVQGVRTSARRIARTEGMRVAHEARMAAYNGLGDLVIGYQIHATMDWRVRPHHAARNGTVYLKQPGAGQPSTARMPRPPLEEDGTVAHNCRCYLTPVMDVDPDIEADPAAKALFTGNDHQLVPDPVTYDEWFATASDQERRWAVGARRLTTVTNQLQPGETLSWAHFLNPNTGQLIPLQQLQRETETARSERIAAVNNAIDLRRQLAVQVSRFGYLEPPPAPPPALPPEPTLPPTPAPVPLPPPPPFITDVDALAAQLTSKTLQVKDFIKWGPHYLVPDHLWKKYKKGKVSLRTIVNTYNKKLAKLTGGTPPEKIRKPQPVPAPIPPPTPTPAPTPAPSQIGPITADSWWVSNIGNLVMHVLSVDSINNLFDIETYKPNQPPTTKTQQDVSIFLNSIRQGIWLKVQGLPPITTTGKFDATEGELKQTILAPGTWLYFSATHPAVQMQVVGINNDVLSMQKFSWSTYDNKYVPTTTTIGSLKSTIIAIDSGTLILGAAPGFYAPGYYEPKPKLPPAQGWRAALAQAKQETPHAAGAIWGPKPSGKSSYGGILIDSDGKILLRKPTGNFGGYHWTWPKGTPQQAQHPADTAIEEVEQETGHKGEIFGYLPHGYSSGLSTTFFYLMQSAKHNPAKMDNETEQVVWVTPAEAEKLINETTNAAGKARDLEILAAVKQQLNKLSSGQAVPKANDAPPPKPTTPTPTAPTPTPASTSQTTSQTGQKAPPPPPDLHDTKRWQQKVQPHYQKPAVGLKAPPGQRRAYVPDTLRPRPAITPHQAAAQFPDNPKQVEIVKRLGGSTGAQLVKDPKTGVEYVRKAGASPDHLREEVAADQLYAACGVPVPAVQVHDENGKPIKLAEVIPGKTLADYLASASPKKKKDTLARIQKGFAADALLANWDVAGMSRDNIIVRPDGVPVRIDNGGSLRFRAQGGAKGNDWNAYPTELWTLADPAIGTGAGTESRKKTAEIYAGLTWDKVIDQVEELVASRDQILTAAPDDDARAMLSNRLDQFADIAATSRLMIDDGWDPEYVRELVKHQAFLRQQGTVGKLCQQLGNLDGNSRSTRPTDENGKILDELRGTDSLSEELQNYIEKAGGKWEFIENWGSAQGGNSWNDRPAAVKWLLTQLRPGVSKDNYYWKKSHSDSEQIYHATLRRDGIDDATARRSIAALHAWTQEMLRNIDMPNSNRTAGTVRLYRTEANDTCRLHGLPDAAPTLDQPLEDISRTHGIKRGAMESFSIFRPVTPFGSRLTVQEVPYHRILGTYLTSRAGQDRGLFLTDSENEFVGMTDGLKVDYYGNASMLGVGNWG